MAGKKIKTSKRKFFLKWSPFNFCDRFCERCEEFRDNCKIYQDDLRFKAQCQLEGKDPYDIKVVFGQVEKNMEIVLKILRETIKKEGIKITKEDAEEYEKEQKTREGKVINNPLYKKCLIFSKATSEFLEDFGKSFEERPWILASLQNEIEELSFYCHLVSVKSCTALHSKIEEENLKKKPPYFDSEVSSALGFYSLFSCQRSLESILNLMNEMEKSWVSQINKLLEIISITRREFKKAFPGIENFRNKIIFHSRT